MNDKRKMNAKNKYKPEYIKEKNLHLFLSYLENWRFSHNISDGSGALLKWTKLFWQWMASFSSLFSKNNPLKKERIFLVLDIWNFLLRISASKVIFVWKIEKKQITLLIIQCHKTKWTLFVHYQSFYFGFKRNTFWFNSCQLGKSF